MASDRFQRRIDRLLDQVEEAADQHDWQTVQRLAQDVLILDPGSTDATNFLAAAERALNSTPESTSPSQAATARPNVSPPASPNQLTTFASGRYEFKGFLGEGGKKKVYKAHDTLLSRDVAFALIKTERLSQSTDINPLFISHVAEDSAMAMKIATTLENQGYSTWYYERDSLPGPAYLAQMGDAIDQSQAMVLIISPQSVGSNQVTTEVVRAHETNKSFIPLLWGISHEEFQLRAPVWRQALGASTSIEISEERFREVSARIQEGLEALGIKSNSLREEERSRITLEAQAMGQFGSHPHVVTVFDLGVHEGQPYLVTELMDGGDVERAIEEAPNRRLPLEQVIKITEETCHGLEFAHSKGIVHCDLKPSNIWLTGDGIAKIDDFGLPIAIYPSHLHEEGMMVGTVSYMAPEQALGEEVTPRSDLYSLGAMLYEMVTGRPPFLGDDSVAIIGQHINTPPVAPTWHNSQCPRSLEALILRLLAKDPSERPESASDVLTALEGMDLTATSSVGISIEESQPLDSLAGGVFVGRQREMGELKACLEDALSGRGRLVTLVGEPGIGKTRTAQELATYAGLRSAQVLWGRCYEEQGMPPYWPWVQAIRSYVREHEPDQLRSEMGAGAADIAEVVSDVKDRLPDLKPPPQLDGPEQARFRLFDSITAFLKSAS
ncbi:MAG: protein kinase, partial [Anaerolineae bacterium]